MRLKPTCDFSHFLDAVEACNEDVYFVTKDGDRLNLKSELCRYIFAVVAANPRLLENGELECKSDMDLERFREFLL